MKVSIIGTGVVGKATGVGFLRSGHEVVFYDIDKNKLRALEGEGLIVTESLDEVNGCDVHMICVPTPAPNGRMDFSIIEAAVTELAKALIKQDKHQVIAIRSTVLPLTTKDRIIPLVKCNCRLSLGKQYSVCHNPEFMRDANALEDFLHPPIIVIGTNDKPSADIMKRLYAPFNAPLLVTTIENAEAIKIFSNVYNTTKISFFNELYIIAERLGLDQEIISQALTKSSLGVRIPEYYTHGGRPFYGKCLPKDLAAFIILLTEQELNPGFFEEVNKINETMKIRKTGRKSSQ